MIKGNYKLVVMGSSAGGIEVLSEILYNVSLTVPIVIAQHISSDTGFSFANVLNEKIAAEVKEAEDKQEFHSGVVYVAPANYHLLINADSTFSLSVEEKVNYSRPSIDVLFESVAMAYGRAAIGVILTGANSDGAQGLKKIRSFGGLAVIQDPETAYCSVMPQAAVNTAGADYIAKSGEIADLLVRLTGGTDED